MSTIYNFTQIQAWQVAHEYVLQVYKITNGFPRLEQYGLISQIQRAAVSIPANIAEGFSRKTKKERLRFYEIAKGSLEETKYYIILTKDLAYITDSEARILYSKANHVGRLLHGWSQNTK